jgi:hypothetical protein
LRAVLPGSAFRKLARPPPFHWSRIERATLLAYTGVGRLMSGSQLNVGVWK